MDGRAGGWSELGAANMLNCKRGLYTHGGDGGRCQEPSQCPGLV